jgi:hypothetical protein
MASLSGFNAANVEPSSGGFNPLPAGSYLCVISKSEMKPTKAGNGEYLSITLDVIEGQFAGRKIFDILNLVSPSAQAMDIAQKTLSSICRAVGVLTPNDSAELHDRPLSVKVKIEESVQYGDKNKVTGYSAASSASTQANTFSQPASGAKPAAKPWQKAA